MQSASDLKKRGVKRTKVTRDDGHALVELSSPALARTLFPPEEGFAVTEVYGYDADLDGHRESLPKSDTNEHWGQQLGCRWSSCAVCHHRACGFCPACNPGAVAPNGEAYDGCE
jgi:hypothetical protein